MPPHVQGLRTRFPKSNKKPLGCEGLASADLDFTKIINKKSGLHTHLENERLEPQKMEVDGR